MVKLLAARDSDRLEVWAFCMRCGAATFLDVHDLSGHVRLAHGEAEMADK